MKQYEYREPNTSCLGCASPKPQVVDTQSELDYIRYSCPKCDAILLHRIATTADSAEYPSHLWIPRNLPEEAEQLGIPSRITAHLDLYWTARTWSIVINGTHISGDSRVTDFAKHLESL